MQMTKGATVTIPHHPDLAVKFPGTLSLTGAGENDLLDVQVSYRKNVVALGSDDIGLNIVSGTIGVTLSKASDHTVDTSAISFGGDGTVEITLPVNTSTLSAEDTDTFFENHMVQCVYWKDAEMDTSALDFGRWSNFGCKSTSVSRRLDSNGEPINTLGFVTCQCNHLTNFAVGFGEAKVRFVRTPTSVRDGDVYQVKSGDRVSFELDIEDEVGGADVRKRSLTPAARSFSPVRFEINQATGLVEFEWTPRDAGTYRLEIELMLGEELVDTVIVTIRVLFCEDFLQAGETLQDVAIRNDMPWQALFAINPQIQNPRVLKTQSLGQRTWICNGGTCVLRGQSPGALVKIGRIYTVAQDETIADVVTSLGSSFTQLERHNMKRIEAVMDGSRIFDIDHRHNATTGSEISYVGEEFCVVSRLADGCLV